MPRLAHSTIIPILLVGLVGVSWAGAACAGEPPAPAEAPPQAAQGETPGGPAADLSDAERDRLRAEAQKLFEQTQQLRAARRFGEALGPAHRVEKIGRKVFGEEHRDYGASLNSLAALYYAMGDYARAEPLLRQARDITKKVLGEEHPDYATSLNSLGVLYRAMGDYARAEPLVRQAMEIRKEALGEEHPDSAASLNNLAALYRAMGDYARAEPLVRQAMEFWKEALGEEHPRYAASLNNLAALYSAMGDNARAEPLLGEALEIRRKVLGEEHPRYATSLNNLAVLYQSMGDYARAEPLLRQARDIRKKVLGEEHPDYAESLNNLAVLYVSMGDYTRAQPLLREARDIAKKVLGEEHPTYAGGLHNLAGLYYAMGDHVRPEPLLRQALAIEHKHRDATFAVQSERQRLRFAAQLRGTLSGWLSVADEAGVPAEALYGEVLRWKGAVFARTVQDRVAQRQPELQPLADELTSVRSRWATLALAVPPPEQQQVWRRQVDGLRDRKETLESELARRSAAYRQARALDDLDAETLAGQLPKDVVLVDFLEYTQSTPPPPDEPGRLRREPRLLAFVVRNGRETLRLDLGPVEPIADAVDRWRANFALDDARRQAKAVLDERIGRPLLPLLADAGTLVVSPDGPLCRFPIAVLGGRRPGSYLIEDVAVAYATSGRQVAELLAEPAAGADAPAETAVAGPGRGILIAGGIDYRAAPSGPSPAEPPTPLLAATRAAAGADNALRSGFGPLPGTDVEARAIQRMFAARFPGQRSLLLRGSEPSETRMKRELAGGWRMVHIATHGFFAPPEIVSAWRAAEGGPEAFGETLALGTPGSGEFGAHVRLPGPAPGRDPQLLSGLVLAGAARSPSPVPPLPEGEGLGERGAPRIGGDDGILTAEEVAALDLSATELVVLSACETGLGAVAGGEGVLGLQRAFHAAGARTTVTSLWRVSDAATSLLMEEFYANLWDKDLTPLDALRKAQLAVLNHPERVEARQQQLAAELADRALDFQPVKLPVGGPRSSPAWWAGFLITGGWQ